MKHHPNGPSSLYRRQRCAASMLAERGLPDEASADADEGTMLHGYVVKLYGDLFTHGAIVDSEYAGLEDEQMDAVLTCTNFLTSFDGRGEPWMLEQPLELYDSDFTTVVTFGTPDAVKIIADEDLAILADWKFGRNPVSSPAMNLQFATYAAMIMQKYGVSRVEAHLIQPRVFDRPEPFAFTQGAGIVSTVKKVIARCNDLELMRVAGDHCKYCKARHDCTEYHQFSTAVVTLEKLAVTAENVADISSFITQLRKQCDRATDILKEVVRESGGRLGNVKLIERKGNRVADSKELYASVQEVLTADEYMALVEPRIAKVEDLYATRLKERGIAETKKQAKTMFNEFGCVGRKASSEALQVVKA